MATRTGSEAADGSADGAGQPSREAVLAALERVVASPEFAGSERRRGFLRFIVDEALAGRAERIKAYAIALEVFGRDDNFDAQTDPIVRIEARRIRQNLAAYYAGSGRDDEIRISIPKGAYVPIIEQQRRSDPIDTPWRSGTRWSLSAAKAAGALIGRRRGIVAASLALVLAIIGAALFVEPWRPSELAGGELTDPPLETGSGSPSIVILPFRNLDSDAAKPNPVADIADDILQLLLQFDELALFDAKMSLLDPHEAVPLDVARKIDVDYVLAGTIRTTGNQLYLTAQLVQAGTGKTIWGQEFERDLAGQDLQVIRRGIARDVARTLAQPYGVIFRDAFQTYTAEATPMIGYGCVLKSYDYHRTFSRELHAEARDCLERTVQSEPNYAQAIARLALAYVDEYRFGYNPRPDAAPLDDALRLARRAVELAPDSAVSFQALFNTLIFRREFDEAFAAAERALAASPDNPDIRAVYGMRRAFWGDWAEGVRLVQQAIDANPSPPGWYFFVTALDYYRRGEIKAAWREVQRLGMPQFAFTHMVTAALHICDGDYAAARRAAARVRVLAPEAAGDIDQMIGLRIQDDKVRTRWVSDLRKAGL
jgi:adenylate cyclase